MLEEQIKMYLESPVSNQATDTLVLHFNILWLVNPSARMVAVGVLSVIFCFLLKCLPIDCEIEK